MAALQSVKGGRLVNGADVDVWLASWGNPATQKNVALTHSTACSHEQNRRYAQHIETVSSLE